MNVKLSSILSCRSKGAHIYIIAAVVAFSGVLVANSQTITNISPTHSTACAIATSGARPQGTITVPGPANIACGGKSDAEAEEIVLSRCSGCTIASHFTHACAAYSETAGNNRNNVASAWAIVPMTHDGADLAAENEAKRQADDKCAANGGIQCYTRLSTCDTGTYHIVSQSKGSAR